MAKRDDEAAARGEKDDMDARIDARIQKALRDFSVEHGWLHADDRDAADVKKDGE